jgi:S1-C subfamily serine protease
VGAPARAAGFQAGDIILGVEGQSLADMDAKGFCSWLQSQYLVGDTVRVELLRAGKRIVSAMTLR